MPLFRQERRVQRALPMCLPSVRVDRASFSSDPNGCVFPSIHRGGKCAPDAVGILCVAYSPYSHAKLGVGCSSVRGQPRVPK
jgi:hypothetical protein